MRTAVSVIVAFVAMNVVVLALSFAPWFILGLDGVLEPGRFDSKMAYDVYALLVSTAGAFFAGCVCMKISRSWRAVFCLALICFAGGMTNAVMQSRKPLPEARGAGVTVAQAVERRKEPVWYSFLIPFVGVLGALSGGLITKWRFGKSTFAQIR
jgi:hypothetical protein